MWAVIVKIELKPALAYFHDKEDEAIAEFERRVEMYGKIGQVFLTKVVEAS